MNKTQFSFHLQCARTLKSFKKLIVVAKNYENVIFIVKLSLTNRKRACKEETPRLVTKSLTRYHLSS